LITALVHYIVLAN